VRKLASSLALKPPMQPIIAPGYAVETDRKIVLDITIYSTYAKGWDSKPAFYRKQEE